MSLNSPRQNVSELLSRKRITVVPKDQQALHEHPNSWATNLKSQSADWVPVPDHVLQSARDAFVRAKRKRESGLASPLLASRTTDRNVQGSSPPPSDSPDKGSQPALPQASLEISELRPPQSSIVNETPRRIPAMGPPPKPRIAESVESPVEAAQDTGINAEMELETNELPTASRSSHVRFRPNVDCDFPSSWSEEDLEMQLPQAQVDQPQLNQHPTDSNPSTSSSSLRESQALNAPPCAQPSQQVVLNTPVEQPPSPKAPLNVKRQRRMKSIDWDRCTKPRSAADSTKNHQRMAPTKTFSPVAVTSSNSTTSSSIIPASFQEPPEFSDVPADRRTSHHSASSANESFQDDEAEAATSAKVAQEPSNPRAASPKQQALTVLHSIEMHAPDPQDLTPYALYTSTYPSYVAEYSGSLWSFVKACMCLEYLHKTCSLRDCLWDEFIRAFSAGYLSYVENHRDPIPAIEWFNNLEGTPNYTSMVVSRTSLSKVMSAYPEKVAEAKGYIKPQGGGDSTTKAQAPSATATMANHGLAGPKSGPSHHEKESARQSTSIGSKSLKTNIHNDKPSAVTAPISSKRNLDAEAAANVPTVRKQTRHSIAGTTIASSLEPHKSTMSPRSSLGNMAVSDGWKYGSVKSTAGDSERKRRLHDYLLKKKAKGVTSSTASSANGST